MTHDLFLVPTQRQRVTLVHATTHDLLLVPTQRQELLWYMGRPMTY